MYDRHITFRNTEAERVCRENDSDSDESAEQSVRGKYSRRYITVYRNKQTTVFMILPKTMIIKDRFLKESVIF